MSVCVAVDAKKVCETQGHAGEVRAQNLAVGFTTPLSI